MSFIDPLLALQDVDMQILRLQQELKDYPARQQNEEIRLAELAREQAEIENSGDAAQIDAISAEIADINAFIAEIVERIAEVEAELATLKARREELAKNVSFEHLRIYDRLRISRRPTIVKLANGTCGGCHLVQPPAVSQLIKRGDQLVICEMCGRILY